MNCSTFYAHYEDITYLIKEIEREFVDSVPYANMLEDAYQAAYAEIQYIQKDYKQNRNAQKPA